MPLQLTREEEEMLNGRRGEAVARAMEMIVAVAEALDAPRLIRIRHAHVSGISYGTIGEPGAHYLEELALLGATVSVPTTVNPIGYDLEDPTGSGFLETSESFIQGQNRILKALRRMGAELLLTCTPYYTETFNKYGLKTGDSVAWGESSAVAYANTVLGLKTNREGGPLALAAAITGRTYYHGLHIDENRMPDTEYIYRGPLDEARLGVIAEILAERHESEKPPMLRLERQPEDYEIREHVAALGAAGSIGMVVIPGVTPLPRKPSPERKATINREEVESRLRDLAPAGRVDAVFIGCPHTSYAELALLDRLLREKARIPVLVSLSKSVYLQARTRGLVEKLRRKGVVFLRGTCLIVGRPRKLAIATNSYKALFYLTRKGLDVGLAPLARLAEIAQGRDGA